MKDYIELVEEAFSFSWDGKVLFTGHPDSVLVFRLGNPVIVRERKMGFKVVQAADANLQLRAYIAMVSEKYQASDYYGQLTQPRVSSKSHIVYYTREDVAKARLEIKALWDASHAPDAPRRASHDACNFCRAQTVCPEFQSWLGAIEKSKHLPVAQWTDGQMSLFEERRGMLEKFLKETHKQIFAIKQADPERLPGWSIKPGANVRRVNDLVAAWSALQSLLSDGFGNEAAKQFSNCCDISIGALEDLIYNMLKDAAKKKSQKEVKRLVNDALSGLIELRQNKPSLVKDERTAPNR
jgi:hypothetical protein